MKRRNFIKQCSDGLIYAGSNIRLLNSDNMSIRKHGRTSTWNFLKPGDVIDVIAPSSPPEDPKANIDKIKAYFDQKSSLKVNFPKGMIEPTPVLNEANTIENRVNFIIEALVNPKSKAIWAILGGGWGAELLGLLKQRIDKIKLPYTKPILGYSDVTALQIFFNRYLNFTTIHCIELGANGDIEPAWNQSKIAPVLDLLTGKKTTVTYDLTLLNPETMPSSGNLKTRIVGGNSLLINALKGSNAFTSDTKGKTLFVESVALGPGEVSRILNGFRYSDIVQKADAVLLGNFVQQGGHPNPPLVEEQFTLIRQFFAKSVDIPVFHTSSFGHGPVNDPLPLNTYAKFGLISGNRASLEVSANKVNTF